MACGAYLAVLVTHGHTAPEPDRPAPAPAVTSTCVAATTRYPDGSTWHLCARTPPPAELPPTNPFSEE